MSPSATNGGSKGPFEGILVVDLSHVLAGPFFPMLLSDLGARVIKRGKDVEGAIRWASSPSGNLAASRS